MKTILTQKQTLELIKLGVPKEKASEKVYTEIHDTGRYYVQPAFTLADLLEILPDYVGTYGGLCFRKVFDNWLAEYREPMTFNVIGFHEDEPIDALYQLARWYYGEYLKSKQDESAD